MTLKAPNEPNLRNAALPSAGMCSGVVVARR